MRTRDFTPNESKSHIYVIIAHAGRHSAFGIGKIKYAVDEYLREIGLDYRSDMNNGNFFVRFRSVSEI